MTNLDKELVKSFAEHRYGYGNFAGKYWFVGKEEGGGDKIPERIRAWKDLGCNALDDLYTYHTAIGLPQYHGANPPAQPTWQGITRMILSAEGQSLEASALRKFRGTELGTINADNCLLELLPLPARNQAHWPYAASGEPNLINRAAYQNEYAPKRAAKIREKVQKYNPKAVVFYATSAFFFQYWKQIAGGEFDKVPFNDICFHARSNGKTVFIIAEHPTATIKGKTNEYYHAIGQHIAKHSA